VLTVSWKTITDGASYDSKTKTIVIDTEGMLGLTSNQNQRSRLLLKVLAVSDIIIYRTMVSQPNLFKKSSSFDTYNNNK
jgi:hypothetical protein